MDFSDITLIECRDSDKYYEFSLADYIKLAEKYDNLDVAKIWTDPNEAGKTAAFNKLLTMLQPDVSNY